MMTIMRMRSAILTIAYCIAVSKALAKFKVLVQNVRYNLISV